MRVSPVGWFFETLEETLTEAKRSSEATHNHPEGIKGAQAVAAAIFLARSGKSKQEIKGYIESVFGYDLSRTTDKIRPGYKFDVSCQGSVPESIICFLESSDYVHAIQLAISIGGDSDTIACITGGIAEAFYRNIPASLVRFVHESLPENMREVLGRFRRTLGDRYIPQNKSNPTVFDSNEVKILQDHFHDLIFARSKRNTMFLELQDKELPILDNVAHEGVKKYYPVLGMCGGFAYQLVERYGCPVLITESWSRVCGGSGQAHEITTAGYVCIEEGFD